jgi:predicted nucleic acid-binding protein
MGWLDSLQGQTIGLDTSPLIYFIEEHPKYLRLVRPFFEALDRGEFQVVTSAVTLLEVLVQPLRSGDDILAGKYREILTNAKNLSLIELSVPIAERAAWLRASSSLRTPDAVQLAAALNQGARFFLTNDGRLPAVQGIELLVLDDLL